MSTQEIVEKGYFNYQIINNKYNSIGDWVSFHCISVEVFLLIATIILLCYGLLFSKKNKLIFDEILNLSCLVLAICIVLYLTLTYDSFYIFYKSLYISNFCTNIKTFGFILTIICIVSSKFYLKHNHIHNYEYMVLILFSLIGFCFLINSGNFLTVYLSIEIQTLIFYILTTFKRKSGYSTEAGLKYFVIGAIASSFLLLGISYVYGFSGKINFLDLNILSKLYWFVINEPSNYIIYKKDIIEHQILFVNLGITLITFGLMFKLTAVPFHIWAVDVYEGAPSSITMFFILVPKLAIFSLLIKLVLHVFIHFWVYFENIFLCVSALSMIVGSIGAFQQKTIKRLFIYSSISHVGFMLVSISTGSMLGIQSLFMYLFIYSVMNVLVWNIILNLIKKGTGDNIKYVTDLNGLFFSNPHIAFALSIVLFSLAGIPPLGGFFSKFLIFFSAIQHGHYFITIIGVISSIISAFYYLGLIKKMFFKTDNFVPLIENTIPQLNVIIVMICLTILLFFIMYIDIFLLISQKFVLNFFI